MTTESRVVGPSALLMISTGAERLSGLIAAALIGRVLGSRALGEYSLVLALWNVFGVAAYFGQAKMVARDVARWPDLAGKALGTASLLALLASAGAGALMFATAVLLGYPNVVVLGTIVAATSFLWADSQCSTVEAMLISLNRTHVVAGVNLAASAARGFASFAVLVWRIDIVAMLVIVGITQIGTAVALHAAARRLLHGKPLVWDRQFAGQYSRGAIVFTLMGLAGIAFKRLDTLLLEAMQGAVALGIYSAAYRIAQVGATLIPPIFRASAPQFSLARQISPGAAAALTHARLKGLGFLTAMLTAGLVLIGPRALPLIFGTAFSESVVPFILLSVATLPLTVNGLFTIIAIATDLERAVLRINIINGVASLALNLALIPLLGATGSAIALMVSAFLGVLQCGDLLRRNGMLIVANGTAAVVPALFWVAIATVTTIAIETGRAGLPVTLGTMTFVVAGILWSYRAIAGPGIRSVAEILKGPFRGRR